MSDPLRLISSQPMAHARLRPPYDGLLTPPPAEVMAVPSMMSPPERSFLYNLTRERYLGEGVIVDAGTFLGASTMAFGAGIKAGPRAAGITAAFARPVKSFEMAVVHKNMLTSLPRHGVTKKLAVGDSFAPFLQRNIAPVRELVALHLGDITERGAVRDPIEILFLDVLKQEAVSEYALAAYFPKLLPGRSIVIQQDYFFDGLPFIRVHQEAFADAFEFIGEIGSSAVFRCLRPVPVTEVKARLKAAPDEQLRALRIARDRSADPLRRLLVEVSTVRLATSLMGPAAGAQEMARIEDEFAAVIADPGLPGRLKNALLSVKWLCGSSGDRKALITATQIAFGYGEAPISFETAFAHVLTPPPAKPRRTPLRNLLARARA
ncbi:MAG TPA: hypothetical protein VGH15_02690 [Caulobacteraceae bacterium]